MCAQVCLYVPMLRRYVPSAIGFLLSALGDLLWQRSVSVSGRAVLASPSGVEDRAR